MNWYTSDEHYNDQKTLAIFAFRKFKNVGHMNYEIKKRHNQRVKAGHTVYHLGDFRFSGGEKYSEILSQLNGNHVFIGGNHDRNNSVSHVLEYAVINTFNRNILLIHCPDGKTIDLMKKLDINICFCGHVHLDWKIKKENGLLFVNVGVDQWNYYPIDGKEIFKAVSLYEEEKH